MGVIYQGKGGIFRRSGKGKGKKGVIRRSSKVYGSFSAGVAKGLSKSRFSKSGKGGKKSSFGRGKGKGGGKGKYSSFSFFSPIRANFKGRKGGKKGGKFVSVRKGGKGSRKGYSSFKGSKRFVVKKLVTKKGDGAVKKIIGKRATIGPKFGLGKGRMLGNKIAVRGLKKVKGGKGKGKRGGKKGGKKGKKGGKKGRKMMNADDLDNELENYMGEDAVKSRLDNDLDSYFEKKQAVMNGDE